MSAAGGVGDFRTVFDEMVKGLVLKVNSFCIADADRYDRIIREVMDAKNRVNRKPLDYRRLKRYDVLLEGGRTKLVLPAAKSDAVTVGGGGGGGDVKYYVHNGELFDVLSASHAESGHGGLHKMHTNLKRKYVNITRPVIQLFLANCETCSKKRINVRRAAGPRSSNDPAAAAAAAAAAAVADGAVHVESVDMRSCGDDGRYASVMVHTDYASGFVVYRPLETKSAAEVAHNLIDVFCVFGAPAVVDWADDDGGGGGDRAFADGVSDELHRRGAADWTGLRVRCGGAGGDPRLAGRRRDARKSNAELRERLRSWMAENGAARWSEGLRFCQHRKNNEFHAGLGRTPFEALFGKKTPFDRKSSVARPRTAAAACEPADDGTGRTAVKNDTFSFFRGNSNPVGDPPPPPPCSARQAKRWKPDVVPSDRSAAGQTDADDINIDMRSLPAVRPEDAAAVLDMRKPRKSYRRNSTSPVRAAIGTRTIVMPDK